MAMHRKFNGHSYPRTPRQRDETMLDMAAWFAVTVILAIAATWVWVCTTGGV